jgi:PAS domain S-box-containing protein
MERRAGWPISGHRTTRLRFLACCCFRYQQTSGLTDMAIEKDAPQTHKVVQAQPSLEIWPFVAVVQASHTPTVLTDPHLPDNPIIFANDAFVRLTGYGRDEVLGRNCRFLRGPETDREVSNRVRTSVDEVRPVSAKMLNYRKDGSTFWNQLHISPIFDEVGMLAYFVGYQHDITEQVEAEQALRYAHQELEGRLAEREGLIFEIHHRVRNNLQIIIGLLKPGGQARGPGFAATVESHHTARSCARQHP